MFDSSTLITFLVASVAIIIAPGPAQALVLTRTLGEGRAAGAMTAFGLNVGTLRNSSRPRVIQYSGN
jgi:threonine/homoserine/homoserine lactone efflux protein